MSIGSTALNGSSLNAPKLLWQSHAAESDVAIGLAVNPVATRWHGAGSDVAAGFTVDGAASYIFGASADVAVQLTADPVATRCHGAQADVSTYFWLSVVPKMIHGAIADVPIGFSFTAALTFLANADVALGFSIEAIVADEVGNADVALGFTILAEAVRNQAAGADVDCSIETTITDGDLLVTRYAFAYPELALSAFAEPAIKYSGDSFYTRFASATVPVDLSLEDTAGWFIAKEQISEMAMDVEADGQAIRAAVAEVLMGFAVVAGATKTHLPLMGLVEASIDVLAVPTLTQAAEANVALSFSVDASLENIVAAEANVAFSFTLTTNSALHFIRGGGAEVLMPFSVVPDDNLIRAFVQAAALPVAQFVVTAEADALRLAFAEAALGISLEATALTNAEIPAPAWRTVYVEAEDRVVTVDAENRTVQVV